MSHEPDHVYDPREHVCRNDLHQIGFYWGRYSDGKEDWLEAEYCCVCGRLWKWDSEEYKPMRLREVKRREWEIPEIVQQRYQEEE